MLILALFALLLGAAVQAAPVNVKVKDLVRVKGANANPLMGYGLVVGLAGSGDTGNALQTERSVGNLLRENGIRIDDRRLRTRNVAAVMVTASLPAFAQAGDPMDVVVSSMGDATSLRGGTLLMTRLAAADGTVLAMAQGPVSTGQAGVATSARVRENVATARVPGGALVLKDLAAPLARDGRMTLVLRHPDAGTAERVAQLVCEMGGAGSARAVNASVVEVTLRSDQVGQENSLLARLGECEVQADTPARVVFNERTGTIVMGGNVRVSPVAISSGGLKVRVRERSARLAGRIPPGGVAAVDDRRGSLSVVPPGGSLQDVVDALNALGASPSELMQVLQALKQAGALQADLEIQ